jgi:hypothetical protein
VASYLSDLGAIQALSPERTGLNKLKTNQLSKVLKVKLHTELELSLRTSSTKDPPKVDVAKVSYRKSKGRGVSNVEGLSSEFNPPIFPERDATDQRKIEVFKPVSA